MAHGNRLPFDNPVVEWIDSRLPIFTMLQREYGVFPTPKNFNYFWSFGGIAMVMLTTMIITGVFLAMYYTPDASMAFSSVEHIMRDVNWGWMIRYLHANGASFFFIAVYIHIFRGMYYGSYKKPRELLWILGVVIFLLMMATAFMGYTLPWSQMGGWGANVITRLFNYIPVIGPYITKLLWGGFSVDNPTLHRFFALHYLLPFVIFGVVILHVWALHIGGSNNPLGVDVQGPQDTLPFHPYYTVKDTFGLSVFLLAYVLITFWAPNIFQHPDAFVEYDPMKTPPHIVPEWYFLPFYAILRSITFDIGIPFTNITFITAGLGGVMAMFGSVLMLAFLPWLDRHPVRSARFRPKYRIALLLLVLDMLFLGYVGSQEADAKIAGLPLVYFGQAATLYYFVFFLVILPMLSGYDFTLPVLNKRFTRAPEKNLPLPSSINEAVLREKESHA